MGTLSIIIMLLSCPKFITLTSGLPNTPPEKERERFIIQRHSLVRFDHGVSVEMVVNGILQAKLGKIIRLREDSDRKKVV